MTEPSLVQLAYGAMSPVAVTKLVAEYGSADAAVRAIVAGTTTVNESIRSAVAVPSSERAAQLAEAGIAFIERGVTSYPQHLDRFDDSPPWLFARGSGGVLTSGRPAIGIVGSRSCTSYGLELAEAYGRMAANIGWSVVSGLARGIDAAAHRGAVEWGELAGEAPCIGVLGCGVDVVYPTGNQGLFEQILGSGGAIVTEFPPGTKPHAWRFPTRNRIIAGLSDVVLVVEATHKGGALITARIALDYGVPVYAVPGDVDRRTSEGTNALIRDGAFPIFDPDDLSKVLELVTPLLG